MAPRGESDFIKGTRPTKLTEKSVHVCRKKQPSPARRSTTKAFRLYQNDSIEKICRDNDFTFIKRGGGCDDDNWAGTLGAAGL